MLVAIMSPSVRLYVRPLNNNSLYRSLIAKTKLTNTLNECDFNSLPHFPSRVATYTGRSANADCTAPRVWHVKRASFFLRSVLLGPNFTRTGSSPAKMFDTVRYVVSWCCYNFAAGNFQTTKLCSRRLMSFVCHSLCEKRQIWVSEPNFGEIRGDARSWLMARWKTHGRFFIRLNWTFFAVHWFIDWFISLVVVTVPE